MTRPHLRFALAAWAALALLTAPLAAAPPEGFARAQPVEISEEMLAGENWVSVRLDPSAARHLGVDLVVISPAGESLPWTSLREAEGRRPVRVAELRPASLEGRRGFWIRLDLGSEPPRHTRLHFGVGERMQVSGVSLEASGDGREWTELMRGDLFRLGDAESFQSLALDYPASEARHLRLFWPGEDTPSLETVWVLSEGEGVTARAVDPQPVADGPPEGGAWTLPLDVPRQTRRLDLDLESVDGSFGLRLLLADDGGWRSLAEETRRASGTTQRIRLPLDLDRQLPARLRLEVRGAELRAAQAWIADPVVAFRPRSAGRHAVAWGAAGKPRRSEETRQPSRERWPRVEAGPLEEAPWPPLPERLAGPAAPLPDRPFRRTWEIDADAEPGDVIRLALDGEVYAATADDPASLRLSAGGRLLPHVLVATDEPVALLSRRLVPRPSEKNGTSTVEIPAGELPSDGTLYSELRLRAPGPFSRFFRLSWELPGDAGEPPRSLTVLGRPWQCFGDAAPAALPCELVESVRAHPGAALRLGIDDGDDAPLPWVELDLWGRRHDLLFVMPAGEDPIHLHADDDLGAPSYDLKSLVDLLRLRPAGEATLGTEVEAPADARSTDWLLYVALGLAVLVLLGLLSRMLGDGGEVELSDYEDLPEYDPTEHAGSGKRWTFPDRSRYIPDDDDEPEKDSPDDDGES